MAGNVPPGFTIQAHLSAYDAVTLRAMIGRKEISPVELLESHLERIDEANPVLNAAVAMDTESARAAAQSAERAVLAGEPIGPLHGLVIGIKDLTATKDLATTYGSLAYKENLPTVDAGVVKRLRAAGAIILCKTNTPEFGAGAQTVNRVYGPTRNPFDTTRTCAGSSGGSAVALATDMVTLATGSDMGGSLRTPAAFCGVTGFRPTPGAIASEGRRNGWATLSVDGPMGRNVADTALLYASMTGADPRDPLSTGLDRSHFAPVGPVDVSSLRVAFSEDLGFAPVSQAIRSQFRARAEALAPLFAEVGWSEPDLTDADFAFEALRGMGFVDSFGPLVAEFGDMIGSNVRGNVALGQTLSAADVGRGYNIQTEIVRRAAAFFQDVDLLICPAASVEPFPVEQLFVEEIDGSRLESYIHWIAITYGITLTTHPALVLPFGSSPSGLPFGIQIVGPRGLDGFTLGAAAAIEAAFATNPGFCRPLPPSATGKHT